MGTVSVDARAAGAHEHDLAALDRLHDPLADLVADMHERRSSHHRVARVAKLRPSVATAVPSTMRLHRLDDWFVVAAVLAGHSIGRRRRAPVRREQSRSPPPPECPPAAAADRALIVSRLATSSIGGADIGGARSARASDPRDRRRRPHASSDERRAHRRAIRVADRAGSSAGLRRSPARLRRRRLTDAVAIESLTANPAIVAAIDSVSTSFSSARGDREMSSRSTRTSLSPRSSACRNISVPSRSDSARISTRRVRTPSAAGAAGRVPASCSQTRALARDVAEVRRQLGARHHVVLPLEQPRPHGAHRRIGDVLQLWILSRRGDRRALARQRRALRDQLVARVGRARPDTAARPRCRASAGEQNRRADHHRAALARATSCSTSLARPPPDADVRRGRRRRRAARRRGRLAPRS